MPIGLCSSKARGPATPPNKADFGLDATGNKILVFEKFGVQCIVQKVSVKRRVG